MLDTVETELAAFKSSIAKSPTFGKFLANPTLSRKEKVAKVIPFVMEILEFYL